MSLETRTVSQGNVEWSNGYRVTNGLPLPETVEIGRYSFDKTEYHIAALQFLKGAKEIDLESIRITIPENPQGTVKVGHLEFPYNEFVYGIIWSLTQMGKMAEPYHGPMVSSLNEAIYTLQDKLLNEVPQRNQEGLKFIEEFKEHWRTRAKKELNKSTQRGTTAATI